MTPADALRSSAEFARLLQVSAQVGSDPLQVQGPGGNTSLKQDGAMWIKASGSWLLEARSRPVMTPVDAERMKRAVEEGDAAAEDPTAFALESDHAPALCPSIETPVHAVLPARAVLHTHCVTTLAVAVREDAARIVASRLGDRSAVFVPYTRPGAGLAREILRRLQPETRVLVLGNHGLVACGETVAEARTWLERARVRLRIRQPASIQGYKSSRILRKWISGSEWRPAPASATNWLAKDADALHHAVGGSLYPDHVVFLGRGVAAATAGNDFDPAALAAAGQGLVLLEGEGAALRENANPSALALARCLGDVVRRLPPRSPLRRLTAEEESELLNWEAERRRRQMAAPGPAP